jgi:hypothetical protein
MRPSASYRRKRCTDTWVFAESSEMRMDSV